MSHRLLRSLRLPPVLAAVVGCACAALAVASAQCNIYGPWLLLPGDAAAEAAAEAGPDVGSGMHAFFPGQPQIEAGDNQDAATITFTFVDALSSIDLGLGDGGALDGALPPLGWDLDGVITCPGNPSCVQMAGTKENCDDSKGRDHTGLELFRQLGPTAVVGIAAANQGMQVGDFGLIVQVKGYIGQPNATNLTVSIFASSGVLGTGDGGVVLNHDGNDKWTVDPRYLKGMPSTGVDCGGSGNECVAFYASTSAYVSDGVLVAAFPSDVPITFGGRANIGGAVMTLSQMVLVGTFEPAQIAGNRMSWRIVNGTLSGRWGSANLLGNMATIPDPTGDAGAFLCGSDLAYQLLRNYICSLQDIVAEPQNNNNPTASCDAISMTLGFTAEPALLGAVSPLPLTPSGCTQGATPFTDSCPR